MLGMIHQAKGATAGMPPTAPDTLAYALENVDQCYAGLTEISKLPPDQIAKLTGVDPRTVTQGDLLAAMREMTAGLKTGS